VLRLLFHALEKQWKRCLREQEAAIRADVEGCGENFFWELEEGFA
jgi:hypothetical protein